MGINLVRGVVFVWCAVFGCGPIVTAQIASQCDLRPTACDECSSLEPCCNLCPCNYIVVESLIMHRDNGSMSQPLVMDINSQETLLSTTDLTPNTGAGFRIIAGHRINECYGIELGYFKLFGMGDDMSVVRNDSIMMPGDLGLGIVNNFFGADQVDVRYNSNLQGVEANLVRCTICCDRGRSVEFLTGFRYFNLADNFSLTSFDSSESSTTYNVNTTNQLYGGQVGVRLRRCYGQWSFEGTGKAGLYGNDAQQQSDALLDFPNNFEVRPAVGGDTSQVAFASDLNFTAIYQLNSTWGVRGGYNLMWLDGVSLAPDQLDFTNSSTSGTAITADSTVFLHGINLGLEARW